MDYDTPNVERLKYFMKQRGLNQRQLSVAVWGEKTHRGVVQEWTTKPDPRCSTLVKVCRVLGISIDSLFQKSDNNDSLPTISGTANVTNSTNVKIDMADLKAENKLLKQMLDEKEKRIKELTNDKKQLGDRLDAVLEIFKNEKFGREQNN